MEEAELVKAAEKKAKWYDRVLVEEMKKRKLNNSPPLLTIYPHDTSM